MEKKYEIFYMKELLEKDIVFIKDNIVDIKDHLKQLNGQNALNTEFRIKSKAIIGATIVIATILSGLLNVIISNYFFK